MNSFEKLPIVNSHITLLELDPLKNLNLKVFVFPSGKEFFLCFFKLAGFQMDYQADADSKLTSKKMLSDSILLKKVREEQKKDMIFDLEKLNHYQFEYGEGCIDIIAEGFTSALIWDAKGDHIFV